MQSGQFSVVWPHIRGEHGILMIAFGVNFRYELYRWRCFCCFHQFSTRERKKRFFIFMCAGWRSEGVNERQENSREKIKHIMYSYRFNCKPHMCTHTTHTQAIWKFSKIYFKIQRENFGVEKSSVGCREHQHKHQQTWASMTVFHVRLFQRKTSLFGWKMFWWKNHVFLPFPHVLAVDLNPFMSLWWKFHHARMLNGVSSLMNLKWLREDF